VEDVFVDPAAHRRETATGIWGQVSEIPLSAEDRKVRMMVNRNTLETSRWHSHAQDGFENPSRTRWARRHGVKSSGVALTTLRCHI
jgi:hypothetical protein